jgi:hypothetical protein
MVCDNTTAPRLARDWSAAIVLSHPAEARRFVFGSHWSSPWKSIRSNRPRARQT